MKFLSDLQAALKQAFLHLYQYEADSIVLQSTKKEFEGSHTFVTFSYSKNLGKKPADIAQDLGEYLLAESPLIKKFNVVQGFLNLSLRDSVWLEVFKDMQSQENFGLGKAQDQKVLVEYSSPNTNKPLHLGHLRNNFLGYAIAQILQAQGYEVHKTQIINDRGIHICKSMLAYQQFGQGETPQSSGLKGDHLVGKYYVAFDKAYKAQIAEGLAQGLGQEEAEKQAPIMLAAQEMLRQWEQQVPEVVALWQKMNSWVYEGFETTYQAIGVDFDSRYYESNTYLLGKDIVEEGLAKGVFYKKEDQSVWIDLSAEGLDHKLVLRGDGTSVYITQDLGTAERRFQEHQMQKMVYVVGNEQDYHFKVLFLILQKLGRSYAPGLFHLSYGMVDLPTGKMKSREGTVVDADDLVAEVTEIAKNKTEEKLQMSGMLGEFSEEERKQLYRIIGLGALKYFLLKVDPKKRMTFDPNESVNFEGDAAPFIQYTHARIKSVLRKAEALALPQATQPYSSLQSAEVALLQALSELPAKIQEAADTYSPSLLAQYAYELTKLYNSFYAELSILKAEQTEAIHFRVQLSALVAHSIKQVMGLLGIEVPERM